MTSRRTPRRSPLTTTLLSLLFSACADAPPPADPAELLTVRTVGLAYLEEHRLEEAEAEFLRLVEMAPEEPLGYANLGLTYLRQGRLTEAEAEVRRAIELLPSDSDVRLILVEILRAQERDVEARSELEASLVTDSSHVKTLYVLATLDADSTGPGPAVRRAAQLERVVALQPGNVAARVELVDAHLVSGGAESAAIHLEQLRQLVPEIPVEGRDLFDEATLAAQRGDAAGARSAALAFHNVMRTTPIYQQGLLALRGPGGVLLGFPVVTFSETLGAGVRDPETVLAALRFTDVTETVGLPRGGTDGGALAVADYDGDNDRDIFSGGVLWRNDPTGFVDVSAEAGVTGPAPDHALFGDYDNDGALDLFLSRGEVGVLYRNIGDGTFEDVSAELEVSLAGGAPLFIDFDQDGDLDLLVAGSEGTGMYRNNLDGTFTDVSARAGTAAAVGGAEAAAAFGDFDDDDDLDLIISGASSTRFYDNQRSGVFVDVTEERGITPGGAGVVSVGDYNNDGFLDLLTAVRGGRGLTLQLNDGHGAFQVDERPAALLEGAATLIVHDAAFVDFDNDGWLDVVLVGESGDGGAGIVRLFRSSGPGRFDDVSDIVQAELPPLRRLAFADFGDDGDLDLFVSAVDGSAHLIRNDGGDGNRYLKMRLVGLSTGSGKNNYFGIGAKVEVRAGGLYQTLVVTGPEIHIGLGQHARADVVRVRWTNGVPQNLFYPNANQSVVEEQILKGSCPFLYTWNGERFEFVTDLMWKSALGMPMGLMAQGETAYAPPMASQGFVRIPGHALRPQDGVYELRITGELWEVFYIDEVELVVVDHPDSVDVFVDERFVFPEPNLPLVLHQVAEQRAPLSAVDGRGIDVLPRLLHADDWYVDELMPDRYQGLSALHDLVLDLGAFPQNASVELYMRGWIFPTDASINVALTQSETLETIMPYLEVVGASGAWVTAVEALSFPAGKNKLVIQDLTGAFPTEDHRVRIRTNMNIYWDHAFFTVGETVAPVKRTTLQPFAADFHFRGFSKLYRKGGRFGPHWFDYESLSTESPWRPIMGRYTRYGDVLELVRESDDIYPIMGPGDEITFRFDAAEAPPLPEGWTRDFMIYTDGWVKDADLNTAEGWRVEPLPFHAMSEYPYGPNEAYPRPDIVQRYHTRAPTPAAVLGGGAAPDVR